MTEGFSGVEDKMHTVAEVASIFSVKETTVRFWITKGDGKGGRKLAAMKVGKSWRVSRAAMVDWANKQMEDANGR